MIGAVIADMLSMKKVVKLYLIVSVIYIALGIFNGGGSGMVSFLVFFAVMLVLASFSYNDICHWDKFINVTPVRRIEIVAAKYIFALTAVAVSTLIGEIVLYVTGKMSGRPLEEDMISMLVVSGIGMVYLSIMLPILFKVGAEKGRIIMFVVLLIPVVGALLISKDPEMMAAVNQIDFRMAAAAAPFAVAAIFVISFFISYKIYKSKEF